MEAGVVGDKSRATRDNEVPGAVLRPQPTATLRHAFATAPTTERSNATVRMKLTVGRGT